METCSYQETDLPYATLPDVRPSTIILANAPKRREEVETASFVYQKGIAASTFSGREVGWRPEAKNSYLRPGLFGPDVSKGFQNRIQPLAHLFWSQWAMEKINGIPVAAIT